MIYLICKIKLSKNYLNIGNINLLAVKNSQIIHNYLSNLLASPVFSSLDYDYD